MSKPVAIFLAFALALPASAGAPLPHWTAPGWYHMKEGFSPGEYWIYAGPFPTERVCKATLPVNRPERLERYRCEYFATRPAWDL